MSLNHKEFYFTNSQNQKIFYQSWIPENFDQIILIAHGLGEHSGRYKELAQELNSIQCAVYAIDHQGHGKSEGLRAFITSFESVIKDMDFLVEIIKSEHPGKNLSLLGHSMGGALSLKYSTQFQNKIKALILSGPAVVLVGAPWIAQMLSLFLSWAFPKLRIIPVQSKFVSRDLNIVSDYDRDPLNCHGRIPARTIGELVQFSRIYENVIEGLQLPTLIMHGDCDKLADVKGAHAIFKKISSVKKTIKVYKDYFHEIFNELPEARKIVFTDLKNWILNLNGKS